ncbi:hypothetical protein JB92DRAFT_1859435 [Gautieria morchelliformis]|nr:hypothetical protein JB92DRAFT_1859435 [Gautieria morchelliformis]
MHDRLPSYIAVPPQSSGNTTSRAGDRRERNDTSDTFSTPQRGSGSRHRTGITPARGLSLSLQGSPRLPTVEEESTEPSGPEVDEDGIARSPPPLRTLYGTELAGHTRFGDYGRDVGRHDWGKALPRYYRSHLPHTSGILDDAFLIGSRGGWIRSVLSDQNPKRTNTDTAEGAGSVVFIGSKPQAHQHRQRPPYISP